MEPISPQTVYNNLDQLDQADIVESASVRQQAQEILADPQISLSLREAIADRLRQANQFLTRRTVTGGDSY
ncbi:MAG: hypothetical protein ACKO7W_03525 [Elainella sp.]